MQAYQKNNERFAYHVVATLRWEQRIYLNTDKKTLATVALDQIPFSDFVHVVTRLLKTCTAGAQKPSRF